MPAAETQIDQQSEGERHTAVRLAGEHKEGRGDVRRRAVHGQTTEGPLGQGVRRLQSTTYPETSGR